MSMNEEKVRKLVRESYAEAAKTQSCCCGAEVSEKIGYTKEQFKSVPEGAAHSFGCGNPLALASLKEGETVVDLGSGTGLDCFIASKKVGEKGKVIGVDMTPEMLDRARENLKTSKQKNVEFRLGEIENLPVADNTADLVISNCVINLSPDKKRVFDEAFRVLKPGGRLMISDMVLLEELPEAIKKNAEAYVGCVSGALMKNDYLMLIESAGFQNVKVVEEARSGIDEIVNDHPEVKTAMEKTKTNAEDAERFSGMLIASIRVSGTKPK
jgi:ubiquinone/menaquinone biosynthesis C-methylase UbiE